MIAECVVPPEDGMTTIHKHVTMSLPQTVVDGVKQESRAP